MKPMKKITRNENFLYELKKKEMKHQNKLIKFEKKKKNQEQTKYQKLLLQQKIPCHNYLIKATNIDENHFYLKIDDLHRFYTRHNNNWYNCYDIYYGFISSDSLYLEKWRWEDLFFNEIIEEISFFYKSNALQHLHIIKSFIQKNSNFQKREIHISRDSVYKFSFNDIEAKLLFPKKEIGGCRIKIICELDKKTFISNNKTKLSLCSQVSELKNFVLFSINSCLISSLCVQYKDHYVYVSLQSGIKHYDASLDGFRKFNFNPKSYCTFLTIHSSD